MNKPNLRSIYSIIILVTILITPFLPLIPTAEGQYGTMLYTDPATIAPPTYEYLPADQFAVSIMISGAPDLKSWGVELHFSGIADGVLKVNETVEGDFLQIGGSTYFTSSLDNNAGILDLACVIIGAVPGVSGDGWLATVIFEVVGGGESPLDLQNTELLDSSSVVIPHDVTDGFFVGAAPFAFFSYRPYPAVDGYAPSVNQSITFNATASYDTSGGNIVSYAWDFDDGNQTTVSSPIIVHTYIGDRSVAGQYTVNLTVTSDDGHSDSYLDPTVDVVFRDIGVSNMIVEPGGIIKAGTLISINVTVENIGTGTETFNVTTFYNDIEINTTTIRNLNPIPPSPPYYHIKSFIVKWDTTGVATDVYTLKAVVTTHPVDNNMTNNEYIWGDITISLTSFLQYSVKVFGKTFRLALETNSTVSNFRFDYANKRIVFDAAGPEGLFSYSNLTVPMTLLNVYDPASWTVELNSTSNDFIATSNGTHYFVYFNYTFSSYYVVFVTGDIVPIPPQPVLVLSTGRASVGQIVTLNGTLTTDPDGHGIILYSWRVYRLDPQGNPVTVWSRITTQNLVTVIFNQSYYGTSGLLVDLTVTNDFGMVNASGISSLVVLWPFDIAVVGINIVKNPVSTGEVMFFNVTVTSNLDVHGDLMRFRVSIYGNDTLLATQRYPSSLPLQINAPTVGTTVRVDYSWNTTGLSLGVYTIKATATVVEYGTISTGLPPDANAADNTFTLGDLATVEKWDSVLDLIVSPSFLNFGQETTASGSLQGAWSEPVQAGAIITVRYKLGTATQWSTAGTASTTAQGTYLLTWKPLAAGTYEVSASWDGDSITFGDVSNTTTLTVRKAVSTLTISVSSQSTAVGSAITISGQATPGVADAIVTISVNRDGAGWTTAGTTTTDEDGYYEYEWTPSEAGTYQVRASWNGDANTIGAESDVKTVTVSSGGLGDFYVYIAAGAIILIAVVAVVFFLRRKR